MRRERITITLRSDIIKKIDTIIDGKDIRNRSNAIETILLKEFKNQFLHQAIILGANKSITLNGSTYPDVLVPVNGESLLTRNIEVLRKFGVYDIVLVLGQFGEEVKKTVKDGVDLGVNITYKESTLGRGNALWESRGQLKNTFLVMNGDIMLEKIDVEDMYNFHKKYSGWGTIAITTSTTPKDLGSIFMKGHFIMDFKEKQQNEEDQSLLINAGVYIFEPKIFSKMSPADLKLEESIFPTLAQDKKLLGYNIGNDWVHLHDEALYRKYSHLF